jgi:hypothetical protein
MLSAKQVADLITGFRAILGLCLVYLGLTEGAQGLNKVVWIMILDWTGDAIDGKIASREKDPYHTWIGDHDLEVDMAVSVGLLIYMIASGFINVWAASFYLLFWTIVFWRWRNVKVLGMLSQAPIYGFFIWIALTGSSNVGIWILVWIVVAIIVTWPQFPKQVVPGFINGMQRFFSKSKNIGKDS